MLQDKIIHGDALEILKTMPSKSVHCCVTSPPYWGLRDYGIDGQIGLEPTPEKYTENLVEVFHEVKRVLVDDGTMWLNLGDCYVGANNTDVGGNANWGSRAGKTQASHTSKAQWRGLKAKNLVGIPWRVAFALQEDGWYLRSDIIWVKSISGKIQWGSCMPESVHDRPTRAHEYIFLLTKSQRYYYDQDAIREPYSEAGLRRLQAQSPARFGGANKHSGYGTRLASGRPYTNPHPGGRNMRTVWTVSAKPFKGAHFAVFPPGLIRPCILAGCPEGGIVLDPFFGSGTVGVVAKQENRHYIGIELNQEYIKMAQDRIDKVVFAYRLDL